MNTYTNSTELNTWLARQSDTCILSFSCGKDSIASWLELRKHFKTIIPVYLYLIPDLEFVEKSLVYYEDFFQTKIMRLPHCSLYRMLRYLVLQAPENCSVIEQLNIPEFENDDSLRVAKEDSGLPDSTYSALGVRAVDSLNRWTAVKKYGAHNESRKTFFPIYDWRKEQLISTIRASGIKLPIDYRLFGRSFDGIDYRFLAPIKEYFPKDYAKILEFFPLADLEIFRMKCRRSYYDRH